MVAGLLAAGSLVWIALGLHRIDPSKQYGILECPILRLAPWRIDSRVAVAPPGLLRLTLWPAGRSEVPLPAAGEARLRGSDGSLFGLVGRAEVAVRPDRWRDAAIASRGRGVAGVVADSVRAAAGAVGPWNPREPIRTSATRSFESALREELGRRGVDLERLDLAGTDLLTIEPGSVSPVAETRLLVIGLDGADWAIVDPLVEQGRMPNLAGLIRRGARAKLLTISPALSPVVWTSIATGVDPARHGILDFLVPDAAGGMGQPVTSKQRKVPTVWELLSEAGIRVGVVGWWATWPADRVNGYLVADRVAYQLFGFRTDPGQSEGKTWPPDLYAEEVRPRVVSPGTVGWDRVLPFLDGPRRRPEEFDPDETKLLDDFRTLLASTETYLDVALAARRKVSTSFESVYFEGTDTVGHLFMPYRPPRLTGVDPRRFESFHDVVDRYYEMIDRDLGKLLAGREGWTVMVLSDHGFASDASRPLTTDSRIGHGPAADWHRRFGILVLSGAQVQAGARLDEAGVYDIAPTILELFGQPVPRSWPGRVLAGALEPAFLAAHPLRYRADPPGREAGTETAASPVDPDAAELREKLRSLGYIGSGEDRPVRATTRNNTGIALLGQGKVEEAIKEFREGLREEPRNAVLLVNLGTALRMAGKRDEARSVLERSMTAPDTRRGSGHLLAQICLDEGDLDGAERYLRQVLEAEPGAAEVVNSLGLVLEKKGRIDEAEAEYRKAAELDPDAAEPRSNLGNLARSRGRLDEAEKWYLSAIDADPYHMGSYNNLALVYQDRGETKKAIDLYDRALSKAPGHAVVLNNLGSLYFATGDLEEARRTWKRAAAADPKYPSPLNNLAGLDLSQGHLDEATELLKKALALDPNYGDARINLALVLRRQGRPAEAREQIDLAIRDPRSRPTALVQAGIAELDAGHAAKALALVDEARGLGIRDTLTLNIAGEAYRRLGRGEEALRSWNASLALDPRQRDVAAAAESLRKAMDARRGGR